MPALFTAWSFRKSVKVTALCQRRSTGRSSNTDMAKQFSKKDLEQILVSIPLARLVEPAEIAEAAFFLASEKSGMITGTVLDINGGVYMA